MLPFRHPSHVDGSGALIGSCEKGEQCSKRPGPFEKGRERMVEGISRNKDGVPQWGGDAASFQQYEEEALQWEQSIAYGKRYLCGPKLIQEMSGTARKYVTGKRPDWLSFNGGVAHLMQHLRRGLGRPQIPELSEFLNRYFKQSRRKRLENMNQYIVRKTEVYQRARQALARVLTHQGAQAGQWTQRQQWEGSYWNSSWQSARPRQNGRSTGQASREDPVPEDDPWARARPAGDESAEEFQDAEDGDAYSNWYGSNQSHWHPPENETWIYDTPELLPDFLQGWYLLMDVNLNRSEKNLIQTAVRGDFSSERIAQELRTQWPEDELREHDQGMKQASYWQDDLDDHGEDWRDDITMKSLQEDGMSEEGLAMMADAEEQAEEALAVIERAKRTLREARAKQHQVKLNRPYYRTEVEKYKSKSGPLKCFKCGGDHKIAVCPDRLGPKPSGNTKVESAPFVCFVNDQSEEAMGPEHPVYGRSRLAGLWHHRWRSNKNTGQCACPGGSGSRKLPKKTDQWYP